MKVATLTSDQQTQVATLKSALHSASDHTAKATAWRALQTYLLSTVDAVPNSFVHLSRDGKAVLYRKRGV